MPPFIDVAILLAGLLIVAAALTVLLRRASRDTGFAQVAPPILATVVVSTESPVSPTVKPEPKRRRPRPTKPKSTKPPTPIDRVVGLLKDPDSLATAFLLREILDKPVSQRNK